METSGDDFSCKFTRINQGGKSDFIIILIIKKKIIQYNTDLSLYHMDLSIIARMPPNNLSQFSSFGNIQCALTIIRVSVTLFSYIYIYIHTYIHIYIHTYIYIHINIYIYIYIYIIR